MFEDLIDGIRQWNARSAFNVAARIRFYRKMVQFLRARQTLHFALETMHRRSNGLDPQGNQIGGRDRFAAMTSVWMADMELRGATLEVLRGWIPDEELGLIMAGEASDALERGFIDAESVALAKSQMIREALYALAPPGIALLLTVGIFAGFHILFAPIMTDMLPPEKWTLLAQWMMPIAWAAHYFWWAAFGGLLLIAVCVRWSLPRVRGPFRRLLDLFPPWSIYKVVSTASVLKQVSAMLRNHQTLDATLEHLRRLSSPYVERYIQRIIARKALGMPEAEAMDVGLFDADTAADLRDLGAVGRFDEVMEALGADALNRALDSIKVRVAVVRYLALFAVGMSVALLILSYGSVAMKGAQEQKRAQQGMRRP